MLSMHFFPGRLKYFRMNTEKFNDRRVLAECFEKCDMLSNGYEAISLVTKQACRNEKREEIQVSIFVVVFQSELQRY